MRAVLPKSVAQLTGVLVTAIVAFGTDLDVFYAMPLGIFAGALAVEASLIKAGINMPVGSSVLCLARKR